MIIQQYEVEQIHISIVLSDLVIHDRSGTKNHSSGS